MPRIDPLQLLKTLSVLLSNKGGIKSSEEVVRLVQLMQKFSKKLVSKSIYIEILRATTSPLLERFLNEKGWDLLNLWFSDAIKTQNWPLCLDIMTLFSECPITASLLKDTADVNPAPKLINQLRVNQTITEEVRKLANVVYLKWVAVVSPQQSESPVEPSLAKMSQLRNIRRNARGAGTNGRGRGGRAQRILSNDIIEDSDDSSMESEEQSSSSVDDVRKSAQPPVTVKIKIGSTNNGISHVVKADDDADKSPAEEDAPINLLKSLAEEVSENLNKEKAQKDKEKEVIGKRRKSDEEKKQKEKAAKEKEKEKEKEKKRKQQQAQNSQMDERERKKFRPDRRDEVDPEEKLRIKEKARQMLEQSKKDKDTLKKFGGSTPHTTSFSRIPKIQKKALTSEDEKIKGTSFEAMLGNLDAKPKTVKTPMIKNKTAALLESFSKTTKSQSESTSTSSKHHSHHHHHHSSSSSPSSSKRESSSKKDKESSSSSSSKRESSSKRHHEEKSKSSSSSSSRPSKLILPKRGSVDLESPKSGGKNTSFSESTGFMDAILNSMGGGVEEPKKKKRRLSERDEEPGKKSPKETPEKKLEEKGDLMDAEEEEEQKPTFSFYRDTLEEPKEEDEQNNKPNDDVKDEIGSDRSNSPVEEAKQSNGEDKKGLPSSEENMPFAEPESLPREVKGILVYHRGKEKRNNRIKFKNDSEIVSIRYFELDEDERVNVNKIKFENMRQIELKMEKAAIKSKDSMGPEETDIDNWTRPVIIDIDNREPFTPGHGSKEKDIQLNREKTVLAAFLYSKETTPDTPSEPDASSMLLLPSSEKPIFIPLDDLSSDGESNEHDYSHEGWPEPHTNQVDRQANFDTDFSLNPALSSLLSSIENSGIFTPTQQQGLSQDELNIFKAQTEAMAKLGIIPGIDIPPTFPPPRGIPPPLASGPPRGPPPMQQPPPNMMPPMENNFNYGGGPEFYGGGGPPPPQGFSGPHFDRGQKFNNFHPNHPGVGRGFPPHNIRGFRGGGGPPMRGNADFYRERDNRMAPRGGRMRGPMVGPPPCKFFSQNGFCRDGDSCRFMH